MGCRLSLPTTEPNQTFTSKLSSPKSAQSSFAFNKNYKASLIFIPQSDLGRPFEARSFRVRARDRTHTRHLALAFPPASSAAPPKCAIGESNKVSCSRLTHLSPLITAESARFSPEPTKHVYALSPSPPTISLLAASSSIAHASTSRAAGDDQSTWKPAPADGYGTITHPDGPRKRAASAKDTKPPPKSTAAQAAPAPKVGAVAKADVKGKGKDSAKLNGMASLFGKPNKPAAAARPIGQLGGLFAPRDPPKPQEVEVAKKAKDKVVPSKRKAEEKEKPREKPKPVKKVANGIFGEEEVDDDDEFNEEDESAMREMEEERQGKSTASTAKADAERQKKELEVSQCSGASLIGCLSCRADGGSVQAMMASDDEDKMVVDPPRKHKRPVSD